MDTRIRKASLVWLTCIVTALGTGLARAQAQAPGDHPALGRGMALHTPSHTTGLRLHPALASPAGRFTVAFTDLPGLTRPAAGAPAGDVLRLLADCVAVDPQGRCLPEAIDDTPPRGRSAASPHARAAANSVSLLALLALWQRLAHR
ncbi:MAG: hypothetical protein DWQ11_08925 [Proteobacteria bacterium]|nr:MAG: hypothetical protein DWQ11_08925 [Pseudomonadota bacterium]